MEFSEHMLVLEVGQFRESDLWLRILSPTHGLFSAFAFGGSRSRRRFVGCLDVFNEILARISSSGRGAYHVMREGVLIKGSVHLRTDWRRMGVAANCARFLQSFGVNAEGASQTFFLMRQTLDRLEQVKELPSLFPLFFRARLAFEQGYALECSNCLSCGRNFAGKGAFLLPREGRIFCRECVSTQMGQRLFLGGNALLALKMVQECPPNEWDAIHLDNLGRRECGRAIDAFIQYHVSIVWEKGRFTRQ